MAEMRHEIHIDAPPERVYERSPCRAASGTTSVTVLSWVVPGSYFVLACADDDFRLQESDHTNNCRASGARVTVEGP